MRLLAVVFLAALFGAGCGTDQDQRSDVQTTSVHSGDQADGEVLLAAFLVNNAVFNSELMAPYDILHHTIFRDPSNFVKPYIVAENLQPVTTFEGIDILPHYSFENAPLPDILVIPSTDGSMSTDLADEAYMAWLKRAMDHSRFVLTLCDGAFPLAQTGALDGRRATTFPADRDQLKEMFPDVDVLYDVRFVVDGKYITSVGGAQSYEPALYLVARLYGNQPAVETAQGMVIDWDAASVPHLVVD